MGHTTIANGLPNFQSSMDWILKSFLVLCSSAKPKDLSIGDKAVVIGYGFYIS